MREEGIGTSADTGASKPVLRWLLYYAQFLVRIAFAGLIYLYASSRGVAAGLLSPDQIVALIGAYITAITTMMVLARGQRLALGAQRCLVAADMVALALGMPQDPNSGLPMLFVFYAVFIDYGLRSARLYLEGLGAALVALAVLAILRAHYVGLTTADGWTLLVFIAVTCYGLATFLARDRMGRSLRRLEEWRLLATRAGDVAVWTWQVAADHFEHDGNGERLFGLAPGSLAAKHRLADFYALIHPDDLPRVQEAVRHGLAERAEYFVEFRVISADGSTPWMQMRGTAQYDEQGRPLKASGATWNADRLVALRQALEARSRELEQANRELDALSQRDGLTGIANRRSFDERLDREWSRAEHSGRTLALLLLDVDHFKAYNDSLGHPAGDACLRSVAQALQAGLRRPGDFVARYGGEEFAVLLPECDEAGAAEAAGQLLAVIRTLAIPHPRSITAAHVTVSIGYATGVPAPGATAPALLRAADEALYRAKQGGRDRCVGAVAAEAGIGVNRESFPNPEFKERGDHAPTFSDTPGQ